MIYFLERDHEDETIVIVITIIITKSNYNETIFYN